MLYQNLGLKVGLTYDLQSEHLENGETEEEAAEFEHSETIEAVAQVLAGLGFEVDLVGNIFNLVKKLAAAQRWDLVFNIAEGTYGLARESQVPCLLDAYQIPYVFSDAATLCLTHNKSLCKPILMSAGIPTPDFFVAHTIEDLDRCPLNFPLFAKPLAEGSGKGINANSKITDFLQLKKQCLFLWAEFRQPVLLETFLPGAEYTVGIVGTANLAEIIGVMEIQFTQNADHDFYSFVNKVNHKNQVTSRLASDKVSELVGAVALAAWKKLGCRDGGRIDIRMNEEGVPYFLEVNPLAGLRPGYSDLVILSQLKGQSYSELLTAILKSALLRIPSLLVQKGMIPSSCPLTSF